MICSPLLWLNGKYDMDSFQTEVLIVKKEGNREELVHAVVIPNFRSEMYSNASLKNCLYDFVNITHDAEHRGDKMLVERCTLVRTLIKPLVFEPDFDEYNSYSVHYIVTVTEE